VCFVRRWINRWEKHPHYNHEWQYIQSKGSQAWKNEQVQSLEGKIHQLLRCEGLRNLCSKILTTNAQKENKVEES